MLTQALFAEANIVSSFYIHSKTKVCIVNEENCYAVCSNERGDTGSIFTSPTDSVEKGKLKHMLQLVKQDTYNSVQDFYLYHEMVNI